MKAAGEILNEEGVQALTTKKLAEKLGVAEGTLYRHFKSKDEIFQTMVEYAMNNTTERLQTILNKEDASEMKKITTFFESQIKFIEAHSFLLKIIFTESIAIKNSPSTHHIQVMLLIKNKIEQDIKRGQKKGIIRNDIPYDAITHIIMSSYRMLMVKWSVLQDAFDIKKECKKISKSLETLMATN